MKFTDTEQPLTPEEIKFYEKRYGFVFPKDYVKFLCTYNGGKPEQEIFDFGSNASIVHTLFGFCRNDYKNAERYYYSVYSDRIPSNTFTIGDDPGGNIILISIRGEDYGKIYFWDHEREADEGEEPTYDNMTLIADSFDDFIHNLRDETEAERQLIDQLCDDVTKK